MRPANHLNRFLKTGLAEGGSLVLLVAVAMPLKYMGGLLLPVRIVGMLHGILFIGYGIFLVQCAFIYKWPFSKTVLAFLLSFIPLGTLFLKNVLKKEIQIIHQTV
jgi:integral membrane protein